MDGSSEAGRVGDRRRILEMLQRGQIRATEADELLAALEGRPGPNESQPESASQSAARRPHRETGRSSLSALQAAALGLTRVLTRAIAGVFIALGRVVGVMARLFGRA